MNLKDPVCGMTVKEKTNMFVSSFEGVFYYFCSARCKAIFDEDPRGILAMKAVREKDADGERSEGIEKVIEELTHEIRNPLTAIGGFALKIYRGLPQDDPNRKYLKMILEDVGRLENMIRRLIELKDANMSRPEPSDINRIIHKSVTAFEAELKKQQIELRLELMNGLPPALLDPSRIQKALSCLIENAIEAMGKPPKVLKISTSMKNGKIEIVVSDTGKGILEGRVKYIFDPLFTSKTYGPGLGLTFAKRIIHDHQGSISVKSRPGKGATFTIQLPVVGL